jgi:hypothetical protein
MDRQARMLALSFKEHRSTKWTSENEGDVIAPICMVRGWAWGFPAR